MNRTTLPEPPNPGDPAFADPVALNRAIWQWMKTVKERIETDSRANIAPTAPFAVSTYTAVSTITGTDATSNFVATLVQAMIGQGKISSTDLRSTT